MNKRFFDNETRTIIKLDELREVFSELVTDGEYTHDEFPLYVNACLDKNGTLEAIPDSLTDSVLYRDMHTGRIVSLSERNEILLARGVDLTDAEEIEYNQFEPIEEETA